MTIQKELIRLGSLGAPAAQGLLQRIRWAKQPDDAMRKKMRILAVDDEPVIGESIAYNLEARHRKISVAPNGREALHMASKQKFDVIITDHRMPEAGGLELVRALRKRKYKGKIIVLSGHLSPENIGVYEELEIDEVISKPCIMEELREVVDGLEEDISLGL